VRLGFVVMVGLGLGFSCYVRVSRPKILSNFGGKFSFLFLLVLI
jgi:hypothetical protein